jgi:hypothetical protein
MIVSTYIVHKFKSSVVFLPISHDELIKEVLFENGGIILINCEMRAEEPYMFILCMEYSKSPFHLPTYSKSPFHLPTFFMSLENSDFESLMKEAKEQVTRRDG